MESVRGWTDQLSGPVRAGLQQGGKGEINRFVTQDQEASSSSTCFYIIFDFCCNSKPWILLKEI